MATLFCFRLSYPLNSETDNKKKIITPRHIENYVLYGGNQSMINFNC